MPSSLRKTPSAGAISEALKHPGEWVYEIDETLISDKAVIPPTAVIGAWKVDPNGRIIGEFLPNPNYIGAL